MNENLQRYLQELCRYLLVRQALDKHFAEADQILGEQAIEDAKYEEYEKYMLAQEKAGVKEDPVMADASCLF